MRLTVFNGSPRGRKSNTDVLLGHFREGFVETPGNEMEVHHIGRRPMDELRAAWEASDIVIVAMPLYVHAMPGQVKRFFEALAGVSRGPRKVGFIVQFGFPEAHHARWLERYLERLPGRLGCEYVGTVVRGAVEGIQMRPRWTLGKLLARFRALGAGFGRTEAFDPALVRALAGPENLSAFDLAVYRVVMWSGLADLFWNHLLKQNGAMARRFDRPYRPAGTRREVAREMTRP